MTFKDALAHLSEELGYMSEAAAKLENQNLADIIKAGAAKLVQAMSHPDVDKVGGAASGPEAMAEPYTLPPGASAAFNPMAATEHFPGAELSKSE